MRDGWIKLHRKILTDSFYKTLTSKQKTVIITTLLLASSKNISTMIKGKNIELDPGEFVISLATLQDYCGQDCSIGSIRNTLKKAEDYGFLRVIKHKKYTMIKILNWDKYQSTDVNRAVDTVDKSQKVQKKSVSFDENSVEYRLSKLLYELILQNNSTFKMPDLNKWSSDMDKIIRLDKRDLQLIERVIRWSQADDFWHKNILSVAKLRKQFDKLVVQMPKPKYEQQNRQTKVEMEGVPDGWTYY